MPDIALSLVKSGRAGWANDPDTPGVAVLVERGTGCVLLDPKGKFIQRSSPVSHPPTSGINEMAFIQHLRIAGNELYVPYMYKDSKDNVTVGIGHKLNNADMAKALPFVERGTNKRAHKNHIINAFNKVKNSSISGQAGHLKFQPLTNIVLSEADAVSTAGDDMDEFIRILRHSASFPDFDTYPESAKMGLLDMAYTTGVEGIKNIFVKFTPAVLCRDWQAAANHSNRGELSSLRNQIVRQWFEQAAKQEPFFVCRICTKRINLFFR